MEEILIVEDDVNINNLLKEALELQGYICRQAFSGTEAMLLLEQKEWGLILLDLMLPGMSGEEVLSQLRTKTERPVMILTAKDAIEEKIDLLTNGADDYITKPFDIQEVIARIQIQLRHADRQTKAVRIHREKLTLDKSTHQIWIEDEEICHLTRQEYAILELLIEHPKQVFSKEDIFSYAWQEEYMGETKTLDVHISNIRKKIKKITEKEYIRTVWGIGYCLSI